MADRKRAREWKLDIGRLPTGPRNMITDVAGVTVGHATVRQGNSHTGVTAILPHSGNLFQEKVVAATHVFNGFGKTMGTLQINELGTIETPVLLTNTLSVGICATALIKYMLKDNPEIGRTVGTINPVVAECNDMYLNDIRSIVLQEKDVYAAIADATAHVEEGAVGAGTGMKCFGLKGGIGTASRVVTIQADTYTLGVLALTNFGQLKDLVISGRKLGQQLEKLQKKSEKGQQEQTERGSVVIIVATDLPVTDRQLRRIIKRCGIGLSHTGSKMGHGSGDLVIGFSTVNHVMHQPADKRRTLVYLHEEELDAAFLAAAEATEEAILNSLLMAAPATGRDGHFLHSLSEYL
ncbi:D-aminopeptidase [Evansella caseinilytica]|uniref:D-aminopeptidase n=1 Tax=Evansella caseinilytica TaxID=1503961 RepID=A0A1H3PTR0_9BACI|nr:P1 family peptidase [Evansella caseinilytica]SDZ04692.1 D-aminopeptidase [Evansella caseinilytica]